VSNSIALGFPMLETCFARFFAAIVEHLELPPPSVVPRHCEIGSIVPDARNNIVRWFLEETRADYLILVDQDHRLPSNLLERVANYEEPVVGALYYARTEPHSPIALVPNPRRQRPDGEPVNLWNDPAVWGGNWEVDSLVPLWPSLEKDWRAEGKINRVLVVGGGCLAIRRDVLEAWPRELPWFNFSYVAGAGAHRAATVGEDVWFCRECARQGHGVYLDAGVKIPHMAVREVDDTTYWARLQRMALELGLPA
jgi:cellulose synthase/poly-beta-1,6-N-acetylglucosamine synthase-like glycosyltransferase